MGQHDWIKVGASVVLVSIEGLAEHLGVTKDDALTLLSILKLPMIRFPGGEKRYISLYPLECALFEMGLPEAFKGDTVLVRVHQELCGVLYGTLTKEMIKDRVKFMSRALKTKKKPGRPRRKTR